MEKKFVRRTPSESAENTILWEISKLKQVKNDSRYLLLTARLAA